MILNLKPTKGEATYLRQMRTAYTAARKFGRATPHTGLGDVAGALDFLDVPLANVKAQLAEMRRALTISAAASTVAAAGVVLLILGVGGRRR